MNAQASSVRVKAGALRRMKPEAVVLQVVFASGVPISEIRGTGRMPQVLAARWAMAYLLRTLSRLSWPQVADRVRPHGTGHSSTITAPAIIELARQEASGQGPGGGAGLGTERNRQARRRALEIVEAVESEWRGLVAGGGA